MAMRDSHHSCRPGNDDCGQSMSRQNTGLTQSLCFVPDGWTKLQIVWDGELDKFGVDAVASGVDSYNYKSVATAL